MTKLPSHFYDAGLDGMWYIVFKNSDHAWDYAETYGGEIACLNGYENAVSLFETIGM